VLLVHAGRPVVVVAEGGPAELLEALEVVVVSDRCCPQVALLSFTGTSATATATATGVGAAATITTIVSTAAAAAVGVAVAVAATTVCFIQTFQVGQIVMLSTREVTQCSSCPKHLFVKRQRASDDV
jgi:hypothetical protein